MKDFSMTVIEEKKNRMYSLLSEKNKKEVEHFIALVLREQVSVAQSTGRVLKETENRMYSLLSEGNKKAVNLYIAFLLKEQERVPQGTSRVFRVCFDCENVSQSNIVEKLKEQGVKVSVANWSRDIGKGIDDLLAAGGTPSFELI